LDGLFGGMKIAKRSIVLVKVSLDGPAHGPVCVIGETDVQRKRRKGL
jgi:hypothetical protein